MKYIILYGTTWHADFDDEAEAIEYYEDLVKEDGKFEEITLCSVMKHHENPYQYNPTPSGPWGIINRPDVTKGYEPAYSPWFDRGKR